MLPGELALAVYQALPIDSVDDATGWLSQLSPWLAAAFLFQVRYSDDATILSSSFEHGADAMILFSFEHGALAMPWSTSPALE